MRENYADILARVLVHEGGYSNHPSDPGGATMKGVTQRVYDGLRDERELPRRSVRKIEEGELQAIYEVRYWQPVQGDRLPPGIDYAVFDGGVNSGPAQSVKWLQRALARRGLYPLKVDGIIGFGTLGGLKRATDHAAIIEDMAKQRLAFLKRIRRGELWKVFGNGWADRVADVKRDAVAMVPAAPATLAA